MNETLCRCLCTFIIYYTTLRNKRTEKTSSPSCVHNAMIPSTRAQPASLPIFQLGGRQKNPKDPNHFQPLSNKWQQLCFRKVLKQYTLKCCLVCAHARSRSTNLTLDTEHHTCSRPCFHPAPQTCIKSLLISHRGRYPYLAAHAGIRVSPSGTKHQTQPVTHPALHMFPTQREISRCSFQHVTNPMKHSKTTFFYVLSRRRQCNCLEITHRIFSTSFICS